MYHNFLSYEECDHLVAMARPQVCSEPMTQLCVLTTGVPTAKKFCIRGAALHLCCIEAISCRDK